MKFSLAFKTCLLLTSLSTLCAAQTKEQIDPIFQLTSNDKATRLRAIGQIRENWKPQVAVRLLEVSRFIRIQETRQAIYDLLSEQTAESKIRDRNAWFRWVWSRPYQQGPDYATFKKRLYSRIDPRFAEYFEVGHQATIRLDEIRWGGVRRDGIPPLNRPKVVPAKRAKYLADSDVIFGVEFNGHARAYPKRILAWHEMVRDKVGGREINGVYCTLCGSMIVYDPIFQGMHYKLGTSGFLYRSNKLMYDQRTKSLWSTIEGKPVVGELVGKQIRLNSLHVVTSTWGAWKKLHPETDVLSLDTGYQRDYGEGVAYAKYFGTDTLMFTVPKLDSRLKNKQPILVLRFIAQPVAISKRYLQDHTIYHSDAEGISYVVVTDSSGASRVYESRGVIFDTWIDDKQLRTRTGKVFTLKEDALIPTDGSSEDPLKRLPAHEAFWFGWYAAHPDTQLIK